MNKNAPDILGSVLLLFTQLSVKAISADKFSYDACRGNFVLNVGFSNVVEKSHHCANLLIAFITWINFEKQGVNILLNNRKLVKG